MQAVSGRSISVPAASTSVQPTICHELSTGALFILVGGLQERIWIHGKTRAKLAVSNAAKDQEYDDADTPDFSQKNITDGFAAHFTPNDSGGMASKLDAAFR
jgi:hypothetical protein